jgi:hypothetical protein
VRRHLAVQELVRSAVGSTGPVSTTRFKRCSHLDVPVAPSVRFSLRLSFVCAFAVREAQAPAAIPPVEFLPLPEPQAPVAVAVGIDAESRIDPEVRTSPPQPAVRSDTKPIENGPREGRSLSQDASTCLPSASAVRQTYPGEWPSWTLRAPGHEGPDAGIPQSEPRPATIRESLPANHNLDRRRRRLLAGRAVGLLGHGDQESKLHSEANPLAHHTQPQCADGRRDAFTPRSENLAGG